MPLAFKSTSNLSKLRLSTLGILPTAKRALSKFKILLFKLTSNFPSLDIPEILTLS